jgi:beta-glucosidase
MPDMPLKELKAFRRVAVKKNETATIDFAIPVKDLSKWDLSKEHWEVYPGTYRITAGNNSTDEKITAELTLP